MRNINTIRKETLFADTVDELTVPDQISDKFRQIYRQLYSENDGKAETAELSGEI